MDGHDHNMRLLLGDHLIHILPHQRDQALELHTAPESLRKPPGDVGVVITEHGYLETLSFEDGIDREIPLSVVVTDSVTREKRDTFSLHVPNQTVIYRMSGLDVVVAKDHGIISHIFGYPRINVRGQGVHIVEIVSRVITLNNVAGVHQYDVLITN